ncbi:MAG TPA: MATE family efflux transporter [Acidimicrobiales bacterium]|nr:MATE family efflux transporter [Acidimicrobiales bacterium]
MPALGSLLVEPIYVLTDTAVVGRLGTDELGGLALASTVLNTLVLVFNFLSYGTTVRVAVRRGRGDLAGGATDALQALWLAGGVGLVVAAGIALTARPLVDLLGHDAAVVDEGVAYLGISALGIPFQLVTIACIGYLYGLPDTRRPFLVLAGSTSLNLVVELLLVFGLDWGVEGSALGTVLAQAVSAGVLLAIVVPRLRADGLHALRVVPQVMWALVKVGGHIVQRTGFLLAALAVATAAASRVGTDELAGHQIAAQLFILLAVGVDMFKVAGQSLVGHALGAERPEEVREVVDHLYGWGWRSGILLTVATVAAAPLLPHLFTGDGDVHGPATVAIVMLGLLQVPAAHTFVLDGVLMGGNDFRDLRWSTTLAFLASLPVFVAVMVWPGLGLAGVWMGMLVWVSVRALKNHLRVRGDAWMASAGTVA